ncbi:galactosyltransferase-related protein [Herbiconiux sp.]|uniref:glycosyltransferase family 2 protein n=1 Tax=Herbiconiux sp. TaxID=1871186 RepID=UPI0025BEC9FD|nr:galactosyltransferase-related protein [Herbiconiux sp.]
MTRVALITVVHGRHDHLARQREALARSYPRPDDHVIVVIDDPALEALLARDAAAASVAAPGPSTPRVVTMTAYDGGLPLAAARNRGADTALAAGADVLVFLDVDCLPAEELVGSYARTAMDPSTRGRLLCGPVAYLPPPPPAGYDLDALPAAKPHLARPAPPPGDVELGGDHDLFWSLSFAVTAETWRTIGGFHEGYVGYGGEDTDFAHMARAAGVELAWVGSARAFHQHHPVESPPVRHLDAILRNAALFHERWHRWPMRGWLDAFEAQGIITRTPEGTYRRA